MEITHLHRCNYACLGSEEEHCKEMFECSDDCVEDDQETHGFCPEHQALADELERIIDGNYS